MSDLFVFERKTKKFSATAILGDDRESLTVLAGSLALKTSTNVDRNKDDREHLRKQGVLGDYSMDPDLFEFKKDHTFSSASLAGGVIQAANCSGPGVWIHKERQISLKRWREENKETTSIEEQSIRTMVDTVFQTVNNSNGQIVEQKKKNKLCDLSEAELESLLGKLLIEGRKRCALTGIPFQFERQEVADLQLYPSADRIDSDGHYTKDNIQLVCRFVNKWKSDMPNDEFIRLLGIVRTEGI